MNGAQKLKAYATSPWHAWAALVTLGPALASADPWYGVLGVAAYLGSWVFLPDTPWFRRWLERREQERARVYRARQEFHQGLIARRRRDNLIAGVAGGALILAVIGGQIAFYTVGPGAPVPSPSATPTPSSP